MDNPDNTYREKVYDFLYRMPVGKEYLIDNKPVIVPPV